MKNGQRLALCLLMYFAGVCSGAFVESAWHYLKPISAEGSPKNDIPKIGSTLHVEASFEDGTFIATHAGTRLFYKAPATVVKAKVNLEAGKAYEVVGQKIQNGGYQTILSPIVK